MENNKQPDRVIEPELDKVIIPLKRPFQRGDTQDRSHTTAAKTIEPPLPKKSK